MATNTDRITKLEAEVHQLKIADVAASGLFEREVALLRAELRHLAEENDRLRADVTKLKAENDALRAANSERDKKDAVVEAVVKELKATTEKWGQRSWQVVAGLAIAVVGGVIGYLLKR